MHNDVGWIKHTISFIRAREQAHDWVDIPLLNRVNRSKIYWETNKISHSKIKI